MSMTRNGSVTRVAFGMMCAVGAACTDLSLDGDEQLSCTSNADCPAEQSCATALGRCVAEEIVAQAPIDVVGDATIDAPRISRVEGFARTTVTVTFTKKPTGAVTGEIDGRLEVACEADDAGDTVWRCSFDARDFPDESDGGYDFVVIGRDGAGNTARARARFELDTTPPSIAPDSVSVTYALEDDASVVRDVSALGTATRATLRVSVTETVAAPPVATAAPLATDRVVWVRDVARSVGPLHVFELSGGDLGLTADGAHPVLLSVVDDVGNAADLDVGVNLDVDRTAPGAPVVEVPGRIVYERVPWGDRADPAARFHVVAGAGAVESGTTVVVTEADPLASTLLGIAEADGEGAFSATLQVIDVPRVFVRAVDGAGNIGDAARVRDVVWTASLGGRRRSDDFSNPHALYLAPAFDVDALDPNLRTEPLRAGDLVDGDGFALDALPQRRNVRTEATLQPKLMSHAMGYLPTIAAPVIFGGIPDRNRTPITDTFVLRNERWVPIFDNPPTNGPLAYDTVNQASVAERRQQRMDPQRAVSRHAAAQPQRHEPRDRPQHVCLGQCVESVQRRVAREAVEHRLQHQPELWLTSVVGAELASAWVEARRGHHERLAQGRGLIGARQRLESGEVLAGQEPRQETLRRCVLAGQRPDQRYVRELHARARGQ